MVERQGIILLNSRLEFSIGMDLGGDRWLSKGRTMVDGIEIHD